MNVLHYTGIYAPAWKMGGPVRSTSQICEGLAAHGHDVSVFTTTSGLEDDASILPNQETMRNGVRVTYFQSHHNLLGLQSKELEVAVGEQIEDFDILHVTGVWQPTSVAACRAAKNSGVPYVVSPRGALGAYSWTQKPWKKYPYWWLFEGKNCRDASAVHYTTTMEMEECEKLGLPGEIALIPNSVGLEFWIDEEASPSAWREKHGISSETKLILNAGRLHHKKGLSLLPKALSAIKETSWKMIFVGNPDDSTKEDLITAFTQYDLLDKVMFFDHLDPEDLRSVYSASDLFVLPSRHENFGNVVIEALVCGCRLILSDQVGVAADLRHLNGVRILTNDSDQWSQAISEELEECRLNSVEMYDQLVKQFSVDSVVGAFESLYQSLKH